LGRATLAIRRNTRNFTDRGGWSGASGSLDEGFVGIATVVVCS
jgi:hypothetical protein